MRSVSERILHSSLFWRTLRKAGDLALACGFEGSPPPLKITQYKLSSPHWPQGRTSLKIALAADFHAGCTSMPLTKLEEVVARINSLNADIILLPGDFLNSPYGSDGFFIGADKVANALQPLHAPLGIFATLGNHDIYEDPYGLDQELSQKGIRVLFNNSVVVSEGDVPFNLVGVGDCTTNNANSATAFRDTDGALPVIAICHNPYSIYEMPQGIVAAFAGHTHGTQFRIPGIKQPIQGCPDSGLDYGVRVRDEKTIIITSGIGTSVLPFRNHAPEIVEIIIGPQLT